MSSNPKTSSITALKKYFLGFKDTRIADLFLEDEKRFDNYHVELDHLTYDYSMNLVDDKALKMLFKLAESIDLKGKISDLFSGAKVNYTENRAALHHVLRAQLGTKIGSDGKNVVPGILKDLSLMLEFAEKVRSGEIQSASGDRFINVVNIGIGGSDLGPRMAIRALRKYSKIGLNFSFLSNIDGAAFDEAVRGFAPEHTLFIVTSKTFTTTETIKNFEAAREWVVSKLGKGAVEKHFVAVTASPEVAYKQGFKHVFNFPKEVGGRYSVFSSVGLALAIAIGEPGFREFLAGAHEIDEHFLVTSFEKNIPVLMGLLEFWYTHFFETKTRCVVAYDERLSRLPDYLAQLICESNGKSVDGAGKRIDYQTSPVVFGGVGTDVQHSFFQMVHQGTQKIPCDFIGSLASDDSLPEHHTMLLSNMLGQAVALMRGRDAEETRLAILKAGKVAPKDIDAQVPWETFAGNVPVNLLLVDNVTPYTVGMLIALYEHKTYVEAMLWDINPFDQFGVELGKKIASSLFEVLKSEKTELAADMGEGILSYVKSKRKF